MAIGSRSVGRILARDGQCMLVDDAEALIFTDGPDTRAFSVVTQCKATSFSAAGTQEACYWISVVAGLVAESMVRKWTPRGMVMDLSLHVSSLNTSNTMSCSPRVATVG